MFPINVYLDDFGEAVVSVSRRYFNGDSDAFYLCDDEKKTSNRCVVRYIEERDKERNYIVTLPADLQFGKRYYISDSHGKRVELQWRHIVSKAKFHELFTYRGNDLGSRYHPTYTSFALWAPTAVAVTLQIVVDGKSSFYEMERSEFGVYRFCVHQDLKNALYQYLIDRNGEVVKSLDPYGFSSNANSEMSAVIDLSEIAKIEDSAVLPKMTRATEAVIYEVSVRDFTSMRDCGVKSNGTFAAFLETGLRLSDEKIGFDYLCELGVTHVQLLPLIDFATTDELDRKRLYNWGYDPSQVMALDGSFTDYADDPYDRMIEFKKLVSRLHQKGMRVNMDVVYNHMYDTEASPLHKSVPYYFFRYNESGYLSNGSYCGNDLATEKPMMRNLLVAAIEHLMKVYGVDGFRFDLMGLIDVDTMNLLKETAWNIKKDAMLYGEGWDMPTALSSFDKSMIYNQNRMHGIAHFNDTFRDVIKGATSDDRKYESGYLTGNTSLVFEACSALYGHAMKDPYFFRFDTTAQTINGVETHDNATAWDKMHACCSGENRELRVRRQKMMIAFSLFAQGIPFLHAGVEFCETKFDHSNSYNAPDSVNGLNWNRMLSFRDVVKYTKSCIALRKAYPGFHLQEEAELKEYIHLLIQERDCITYEITMKDEKLEIEKVMVVINPSLQACNFYFDEPCFILMDENGDEDKKRRNEVLIPACSVCVYGF